MKKIFPYGQIALAKYADLIECSCAYCNSLFLRRKGDITRRERLPSRKNLYCSRDCVASAHVMQVNVQCIQCAKQFSKPPKEVGANNFCSRSCAATYNNAHKTYGTRRSKLEVYLQEQLTQLYPTLTIEYNSKSAINSELDIYIPSLKLAFEMNGIYHYEPIHGLDKLQQIQSNDGRKFAACREKEIALCVIDTSSLKHFKEHKAKQFLDIIVQIINDIK